MLEIQLSELASKFGNERVVVATSYTSSDDLLAKCLVQKGYQVFRGSENDLVDRFINTCGTREKTSHIVRVCSDNPFLRAEYVTPLLECATNQELDYVSFCHKDGTPTILGHTGLFTEIIQLRALRKIREVTESHSDRELFREHPTLYLLRNPAEFRLKFLEIDDLVDGAGQIRLTVDTAKDFEIAQELYGALEQQYGKQFTVEALVREIHSRPKLYKQMAQQIYKNKK